MNLENKKLNDEEINELAAEWYFLSLQTRDEEHQLSDDSLNRLIELGLKLRSTLKQQGYSKTQPLNIFVDDQTYLDIWIDEVGQIRTGALFTDFEESN